MTLFLVAGSWAQALEIRPYTGTEFASSQKAGKPVVVIFHADWCPTCKVQQQTLETLKKEAGLELTVLVADYDKEKDLRRAHKVRSQSTLVAFKGEKETGRIVGDTAPDKIRALLKTAL
ncbi:MAG: thioredoxin family protein [Burkholderiales bacterium]